ncbi:hypothetical protein C8J56DRAFT_104287 [Mycena floridula]|nr:hypothetical protein C8J56DRAFT_104287 [Mycena floridula]
MDCHYRHYPNLLRIHLSMSSLLSRMLHLSAPGMRFLLVSGMRRRLENSRSAGTETIPMTDEMWDPQGTTTVGTEIETGTGRETGTGAMEEMDGERMSRMTPGDRRLRGGMTRKTNCLRDQRTTILVRGFLIRDQRTMTVDRLLMIVVQMTVDLLMTDDRRLMTDDLQLQMTDDLQLQMTGDQLLMTVELLLMTVALFPMTVDLFPMTVELFPLLQMIVDQLRHQRRIHDPLERELAVLLLFKIDLIHRLFEQKALEVWAKDFLKRL